MAKATRVLAALERDGWLQVRRRGSHRILHKDDRTGLFTYHDRDDLGGPAMALVAREFGYTLAELRSMI